jgi:hypothetical protein
MIISRRIYATATRTLRAGPKCFNDWLDQMTLGWKLRRLDPLFDIRDQCIRQMEFTRLSTTASG